MSGIINALFGHNKNKDDKKTHEKVDLKTTSADSVSPSSIVHTATNEDVHVQSVVSTETNTSGHIKNSKKITDLMNKLGTTHNQIDEYSKKRNAEISEATTSAIERVVADTENKQQELLKDAHDRSMAIETEYKRLLEERVAKLDSEKAVMLSDLERLLNQRQEEILVKARQNIDEIQNSANQEKMAIFKDAQVRANQEVDQITGKVAELVNEDAQRRLQSTTHTVITTKSVAGGEHHASSTTTTDSRKTSTSHHPSQ